MVGFMLTLQKKKWNEPYMYENWEWGKDVASTVKIYAFEEAKYEDVTSKYKQKANAGDALNFLTLSEIFLVTFSILYGIMLNSCIGLELFPFGRLGSCCKKIKRRIATSFVIINIAPIILFSVVLYALEATTSTLSLSLPLNIIAVVGTFFLAMSVFGFYRLMVMVIVYDRGRWFYDDITLCVFGKKERVRYLVNETSTKAHGKGMLTYFGISTVGSLMTFLQADSPLLIIPVLLYLVLCIIVLDP